MTDVAVLREQNALLAKQLRIKDARIDKLLNDQPEARIARNATETRTRELEIELCGATARLDILLDDLREARQSADAAQQNIHALVNDLREARRAIDTQAEHHRRAIETQAKQHREERKRMVNVFGGKLDNLLVAHEQSRSQIMQKLTTMDSRMTKRPIKPGKKHGFALLMAPLDEPGKSELRFIAGQADYVAKTTNEYPNDQILFPFTETGNPIDLRNNFQ